MSHPPFRFVHAADLHLERPVAGLTQIPARLRELCLTAPYAAARRVFAAALAEEADFVVLSGDVVDAEAAGPRGPLFLIEQFQRLAERGIAVYWAGGEVDPVETWPVGIDLPENVFRFPTGRVAERVHEREGTALARVVGMGRVPREEFRVADFEADPSGLFTIAAVHGAAEAKALTARRIDYWALGSAHARQTPVTSPHLVHDPGTPQGRRLAEAGAHSATLVEVDTEQNVHHRPVPTDVLRWQRERVVVDPHTTRGELARRLEERLRTLMETASGVELVVLWKVAGSGALLAPLARGGLAAELLAELNQSYGSKVPAAWSAAIQVDTAARLAQIDCPERSIAADFLREITRLESEPAELLGLEAFLSAEQRAGPLASAVEIASPAARARLLREAAALGLDLLIPEEAGR